MKFRNFPLKDFDSAVRYTSQLMQNAIDFSVVHHLDRIDVQTPVNLEPRLFPRKEWIKEFHESPNWK